MIMKFLKVPRQAAEKTRRELAEADIISSEYAIFSEADFVFIPVKRKWEDFEIVEMEAEKREPQLRSLSEALSGLLGEDELEQLTTSFDIIGDIAIVEIPDSLQPKEKEIGDALLKVHKNLRSVFKKLGAMEGEYRVRKLQPIAGEDNAETIYKEHGCQMKLDVSKVYFSVRLSHERGRIAELIKPGEKILALFAGVGPFPVVIAKKHPDAQITAVEINPDAVKYMRENIMLNRLTNINVLEGDAKDFQYKDFDRVIMPLPKSSEQFIGLAFDAAKTGGTIHFYSIVGNDKPFENAEKKIGERKFEVTGKRIVRPYSHDMVQVVLDIKKTQ